MAAKHDVSMADMAEHESVTYASLAAQMGHVTRRLNEVDESRGLLEAANKEKTFKNEKLRMDLAKTLQKEMGAMMLAMKAYSTKLTNYCVTTSPSDPFDSADTKAVIDRHDKKKKEVAQMRFNCLALLSKMETPDTGGDDDDGDDDDDDRSKKDGNKPGKPVAELKPRNCLAANPSARDVKQFIKDFIPYFDSGVDKATPAQQRVYLSNCMDQALWSLLDSNDADPESSIDPRNTDSGIFRALIRLTGESDGGLTNKRCEWHRVEQKEQGGLFEKWSELDARLQKLMTDIDFWKTPLDKIAATRYIAAVRDPKLLEKLFELKDPSLADVRRVGENYQDKQTSLEVHYKLTGKNKKQEIAVTFVQAGQKKKNMKNICRCCGTKTKGPARMFAVCQQCRDDLAKPKPERTRVSTFNCTKCDIKGNHKAEVCRGMEIEHRPASSSPRDRDRSKSNSPTRSTSRARSTTPKGRRTPTPASKRHQANSIGVTQWVEPGVSMLETNVGFFAIDVKISKSGPQTPPNDFSKQVYMYDPSEEAKKKAQKTTVGPKPLRKSKPAKKKAGKKFPVRTYLEKRRRLITRARLTQAKSARRRRPKTRRPWKNFLRTLVSVMISPVVSAVTWIGKQVKRSAEHKSQLTTKLPVWIMSAAVREDDKPDCLDNMHVLVGVTEHENLGGRRPVVPVAACPDTGAGRSVCGPDLLKALQVEETEKENVTITAANGEDMPYKGTAKLRLKFEDRLTDVQVLVTSSVKGRLIVGKPDLIRMRVIPPNFPAVIPDEAFQMLD